MQVRIEDARFENYPYSLITHRAIIGYLSHILVHTFKAKVFILYIGLLSSTKCTGGTGNYTFYGRIGVIWQIENLEG
jgi:hypothetical protein